MNGHFMCRESIPVVTKNYIWHKNSDNEAAFLALYVKNCSDKNRKSQKQLVNNNHAKNNSCLQLLAWFYVRFSPLYSPLCLCHLTLINLNEISQKVNNAVINSKKNRLFRSLWYFSDRWWHDDFFYLFIKCVFVWCHSNTRMKNMMLLYPL